MKFATVLHKNVRALRRLGVCLIAHLVCAFEILQKHVNVDVVDLVIVVNGDVCIYHYIPRLAAKRRSYFFLG